MPAEMYLYGTEYALHAFSTWGHLLAIVTFVPLYLRLGIHSIYEV